MLRAVGRDLRRPSHFVLLRYYSIPTNTTTSRASSLNPTPSTKKPKIDLRPAPIKPIQKPPLLSANVLLAKTHRQSQTPPSPAPSSPKLADAKEEAQQAIHEAETHGILKPPPPGANWFKRTLHTAIQLLKFYYRGVRLIYIRRKEIALIKDRIAAGGAPLTRAEFRLIHTQKDDIKKVVPFLVIALLLEEVIPLIAIYIPSMLPSTCVLPTQRRRIDEKRTEKMHSFALEHRHIYAELRRAENPAGYLPLESLRLSGASTAICGLLGLSTIGTDFFRRRRVRRHLLFITRDDQLLQNDSTYKTLSPMELKYALEERGMSTRGLALKDLQDCLDWWLESVKIPSQDISDEPICRRLALIISSR